ncbi:hypothetical protein D9758_009392 [Tetrapyrgos nigripes]|uniref:DUF6534 domain-containing protein n=1 Tax=Tetrapyrgos nigripes TaxID=182062 RepID=A0A8H5FW85_9AGAR|nr:hypothetical protein D9758_009392 [Tetrapyrgos nigripes]
MRSQDPAKDCIPVSEVPIMCLWARSDSDGPQPPPDELLLLCSSLLNLPLPSLSGLLRIMVLTVTTNFDLTLGALEIAMNVSAALLGCLTVQTYAYFQSFPKDRLSIRILMFLIWGLEVASHITGSRLVYTLTVTDWGKLLKLLTEHPAELTATFYLCSAVTPMVETFYLFRIYRFAGPRVIIAVFIALFVVWARYGAWLFLSVQVLRLGILDGKFLAKWSWLMILQLSLGAFMDALIAITIVFFLRRRTFEEVDGPSKLVTRVVRWTIQTGAIASAAFLTTLTTFITLKNTFVWLALLAILSKIFSNCFVASLNGRKQLQKLTTPSRNNESYSLSPTTVANWYESWRRDSRGVTSQDVEMQIKSQQSATTLRSPTIANNDISDAERGKVLDPIILITREVISEYQEFERYTPEEENYLTGRAF